ncbi:unnamed protein product [Allacma fusca]|uniref:C-type lectin domain-containing protein n=1 Tax=Allacma fusca TaxID=39272 RepID=A0A8J2PBB3_9HEXA|nr:unnamed protein product [Allacma fusca]
MIRRNVTLCIVLVAAVAAAGARIITLLDDKEWILWNFSKGPLLMSTRLYTQNEALNTCSELGPYRLVELRSDAIKNAVYDFMDKQNVLEAWTGGRAGNELNQEYVWSSDKTPISSPDWKDPENLHPPSNIWAESAITVVQPPRKLDLKHKDQLYKALCEPA